MAEDWADTTRTTEYSLSVGYELNQEPGKLAMLHDGMVQQCSDKLVQIEDIFDDLNLSEKQTRNEDTNTTDTSVRRRWMVKPKSADVATLLDRDDVKATRVDIGSPLAVQTAKGVRRYHDDRWLQGYWGNAYEGEDEAAPLTAVPFDTGNIIPINATGFTKAKLHLLAEAMELADNDMEAEMPVVLLDVKSKQDLLQIEEYVNQDYSGQGWTPLVRGEIKPWMGFRFVCLNLTSSRAYPNGSALCIPGTDQVHLPAFFPSGLRRGVWTEFFGDIGPRRDKKMSQQIYAEACSTVARIREEKCFAIGVDHSP